MNKKMIRLKNLRRKIFVMSWVIMVLSSISGIIFSIYQLTNLDLIGRGNIHNIYYKIGMVSGFACFFTGLIILFGSIYLIKNFREETEIQGDE
jgi:hypothetical protein